MGSMVRSLYVLLVSSFFRCSCRSSRGREGWEISHDEKDGYAMDKDSFIISPVNWSTTLRRIESYRNKQAISKEVVCQGGVPCSMRLRIF